MIGGCALNHGLEKVRARGKGPCAKVWDVRARWLCTVRDKYSHYSRAESPDSHPSPPLVSQNALGVLIGVVGS